MDRLWAEEYDSMVFDIAWSSVFLSWQQAFVDEDDIAAKTFHSIGQRL